LWLSISLAAHDPATAMSSAEEDKTPLLEVKAHDATPARLLLSFGAIPCVLYPR
jgi:hypothetical protein